MTIYHQANYQAKLILSYNKKLLSFGVKDELGVVPQNQIGYYRICEGTILRE